ncbi:MAG: hypothetical protein JXA71_20340 [Chitinispirillaceae bacterium]|nr:hypothetical protein [Chitinispirillaceae bacterium]
MNPRHLLITLSGVFGTLLLLHCANPFGGGGTETGSPGMMACAFAVYNEIESPRNWSPESYLPAGGLELDPGRATLHPVPTTGRSGDAAPAGRNLVIMRHRTDTIITLDTLCVSIPLLNTDAVSVVISEGSCVIATRRLNGPADRASPCILPRRDTLLVAKTDSFFVKMTAFPGAPVALRRDTVMGVKTEHCAGRFFPQTVTIDSSGKNRSVIAYFSRNRAALPLAAPDTSAIPLGRRNLVARLVGPATALGYIVDESYSSRDRASGSDSPLSLLKSGYTHSRGFITALSVLFDAGADRRFASINNNRILELDREQRLLKRTLERISYRNHCALSTGDSIELVFDKHQETGLVKDVAIRYTSLPGDRVSDHRGNRIARIHKALSFRDPVVQSIDLHIVFGDPEKAHPFYDNAQVTAKMYYGKGRTGRFEGTLQSRDGRLVGCYTENDDEHSVEYTRATNVLLWDGR